MIRSRLPTLHNLSLSNLVNLHFLDERWFDWHFLDKDFHFLDSLCSWLSKSGSAAIWALPLLAADPFSTMRAPLQWSVGDPRADSSKTSLELCSRSGAPSDVPPSSICQHVFSRYREELGTCR
jgi:hypothetical protein